MQVSASTSHFTYWVNLHSLRAPHYPDKRSFRQHRSATDTRALGQVFTSDSFGWHLCSLISPSYHPIQSRHVCVSF